jgi:hypothetical protein
VYYPFNKNHSPPVPYYYQKRVLPQATYIQPFHHQIRPYPEVDTTMFRKSAQASQKLIQESNLIRERIANSEEFAKELMTAAQESNSNKVKQMIKAAGIESPVTISFTPDGIKIALSTNVDQIECCHFIISLKWS